MQRNNPGDKTAAQMATDVARKARRTARRQRRDKWFQAKTWNLYRQLRKTQEENTQFATKIEEMEAKLEQGKEIRSGEA